MVKEAFHVATTGRPGPVLLDLPKDVQLRQHSVIDWDPAMNLPGYQATRLATADELQAVVDLIRASKRPVIYAGGGVIHSDASDELRISPSGPESRCADAARPRRVPERAFPVL